MKIYIEKDEKEIEIKFQGTVKDLLLKLKINSETVIVVKNKELISEETLVNNTDNVQILSVISGG